MKYNINDKVTYLGKKCIVKATKQFPYKEVVHPYLTELVPKKDYIIYYLKEITNDLEHYIGYDDVDENDIEKKGWI